VTHALDADFAVRGLPGHPMTRIPWCAFCEAKAMKGIPTGSGFHERCV
jgi:hypothetical protein